MDLQINRWRFRFICLFAAISFSTLYFYACEDVGVEANFFKGTVKGELRIDSVVPESTDEIRVALSPDFPPSDFKELQISEVLSVNKDTSLHSQIIPFEMQLPYGKYDATVVIWKEKARSWSLTDIVGLHGNLERFELKGIELNEAHPTEEGVSMAVDLSRVNRTSTVSGTIDFIGDWPANTFVTALIMLRDFNDLNGIPPVLVFIPTDSEQFTFATGISPATYTIIAVVWLPLGDFDLTKLRFLGVYENPAEPGEAGQIVVQDSVRISNINITADFTNVK